MYNNNLNYHFVPLCCGMHFLICCVDSLAVPGTNQQRLIKNIYLANG